MKIKIIGSGSTGNAILFDDVLLDCGLPYKLLKDEKISLVLLTHQHADHLNKSTIRKLHIQDESLKFCCGDFIKNILLEMGLPEKNIVVISAGKIYRKNGIKFAPVRLYHDVPNFGYRLFKNDYRHFHATDTTHLEGITAKNYDSATIECNHDLETAKRIIFDARQNGEFSHLSRAIKTHLNVDYTLNFIKENNIKKLIPVHLGASTAREILQKIEDFNEK